MYLTISKRFELSTSHRLWQKAWSEQKNLNYFGQESQGRWGHGHNFIAYFVFHGPVVDRNGMMMNVSIIKDRIRKHLFPRYDHRFLNEDSPPFDRLVPTPENISRQLLLEAQPFFKDDTAVPVACHLEESPWSESTAYADGRVERHIWLEFSAARRTFSPHLSEAENDALFGIAASRSGHGHDYRLRVTLAGDIDDESGMMLPETEIWKSMNDLRLRYDHRNLNTDLPTLKGVPMTTEVLARVLFEELRSLLPVSRVRLYENDWFFCEYDNQTRYSAGLTDWFYAAHRLHAAHLSESENVATYGKCNNPKGHGHLYRVESTLDGSLDVRSGTLIQLDRIRAEMYAVLKPWNYKHLNLETRDFEGKPTTGENIVGLLWDKMSSYVSGNLKRLRLWETPNNRFTLRREAN